MAPLELFTHVSELISAFSLSTPSSGVTVGNGATDPLVVVVPKPWLERNYQPVVPMQTNPSGQYVWYASIFSCLLSPQPAGLTNWGEDFWAFLALAPANHVCNCSITRLLVVTNSARGGMPRYAWYLF